MFRVVLYFLLVFLYHACFLGTFVPYLETRSDTRSGGDETDGKKFGLLLLPLAGKNFTPALASRPVTSSRIPHDPLSRGMPIIIARRLRRK